MLVTTIVDKIENEMKDRGLEQSTFNTMYYGVFKPIINLHEKSGDMEYAPTIIQSFEEDYDKRFEEKAISRSHYSTVRRAIRYIKSCSDTGTVDFSYCPKQVIVKPSPYHLDLIEECLSEHSFTSSGHRESIHLMMRHFFCFLEGQQNEPIDTISDIQVRKFILYAGAKYEGSIDYVMHAVRILSPFLQKKGILKGNVDYSVFSPKAPRTRLLPAYSSDEALKLANATDDSPIGMRNRAMFFLAYGEGLRAGDIIKLTLDDFDWKTGELHFIQSKVGSSLRLSLNPTTMNAVADYILHVRPKDIDTRILFLTVAKPYRPLISSSSVTYMVNDLEKKGNVEHLEKRSAHGLRRARGINLAEAGIPLTTISQMLGHRNFSSDRRYLTFNRDQTEFCALNFDLVPITYGFYAENGGEAQ